MKKWNKNRTKDGKFTQTVPTYCQCTQSCRASHQHSLLLTCVGNGGTSCAVGHQPALKSRGHRNTLGSALQRRQSRFEMKPFRVSGDHGAGTCNCKILEWTRHGSRPNQTLHNHKMSTPQRHKRPQVVWLLGLLWFCVSLCRDSLLSPNLSPTGKINWNISALSFCLISFCF